MPEPPARTGRWPHAKLELVMRRAMQGHRVGDSGVVHADASPYAHCRLSTREQNEKKFGDWDELTSRGRRYRLDVRGRLGWLARHLKEVDANETTIRFWQEIYDDQGKLVEIHEKYPVG